MHACMYARMYVSMYVCTQCVCIYNKVCLSSILNKNALKVNYFLVHECTCLCKKEIVCFTILSLDVHILLQYNEWHPQIIASKISSYNTHKMN